MKKRPEKRLLGRRELIDLPALGLRGVVAKVDTGAYTSAIDCADLHLAADPATGEPVLHVRLFDPDHPATDGRALVFREFGQRSIRSSNGEVQVRYVIRTVVLLYGQPFETEFSLASEMLAYSGSEVALEAIGRLLDGNEAKFGHLVAKLLDHNLANGGNPFLLAKTVRQTGKLGRYIQQWKTAQTDSPRMNRLRQ